MLAAIGYRGKEPAELPFDDFRGVIPSQDSRILNGADPVPCAYVSGWTRRGPWGIIGSNKKFARDCARADGRCSRRHAATGRQLGCPGRRRRALGLFT